MKKQNVVLWIGVGILLLTGRAFSGSRTVDDDKTKELEDKLSKTQAKLDKAQEGLRKVEDELRRLQIEFDRKLAEASRQILQRQETATRLAEELKQSSVRLEAFEVKAQTLLTSALKDSQATVRRWSAESIGKLEFKRAVPDLVQALKDSDESVRKAAGEALKKLDPKAAEKAGVQ